MKAAHALCVFLLVCVVSEAAFGKLAFTILGDWGKKVSFANKAIANRSLEWNSKFIMALGDNFYGAPPGGTEPDQLARGHHGVASVSDPKWKSIFEDVYTHPFYEGKPWYVIAGNHDYDGNEKAQLEYAKINPRWKFPSLYYKFTRTVAPGVTVQFFMLDTTPLYYSGATLKQYGWSRNDAKQMTWLTSALKNSKATWKIVMGHHQAVNTDSSSSFLTKKLQPLFTKYKVAAYVNGHIHNMQVVKYRGTNYINAGNVACDDPVFTKKQMPTGATPRFVWPTEKLYKSPLCQNAGCRGFAMMSIESKKTLKVGFFDRRNLLLKTLGISNPNVR